MPETPKPETAESDESRIARLRGAEAVVVGKRLIRKHPDFAGGYELAARGYEDLGRLKSAVRVLERGVARRGDNWRLLESLAIRYSDRGRLDEALALIDRAMWLESQSASLHYNRALLLVRMNRHGAALSEAWQALQFAPEMTRAALLAASLECAAGELQAAKLRLEETIARLTADRSDLSDPSDPSDPASLSDAYRALAEIELAYHNRGLALELFWKALACEKHNAAARYWVRELSGERSPDSRYWRIVVLGLWPAELPSPPEYPFRSADSRPEPGSLPVHRNGHAAFSTLYDVVAETPEEALEFIRALEPMEVRRTLRIDSSKIMKRSVSDPKGVYRTSPYRWADPRE